MYYHNKRKKVFSLLLSFSLLTLISCEKSRPDSEFMNASTSQNITEEAGVSASVTGSSTHFGALVQTPSPIGALDFKLKVAGFLGIDYLRDAVNLDRPKTKTMLTTEKRIIMNVNLAMPRPGKPLHFADDTVQYKMQLENVLRTFQKKPEIVVIENEANNALYYDGTAKQYIKQLTAAINFFHAHGIKVTDAGVTSTALKYLLLQTIDKSERLAFQQRMGGGIGGRRTEKAAAFADSVLTALRTMDIDYVNFHWYQNTTDTQDLENAANYVWNKTGKRIITNETGQSDSNDPQVTLAMIKKYKTLNMPYVLWYSGNSNNGERARALHFNDGSLDVNGKTYAAEIKQ